ncbi:MAG TPA: poly(3-hydroxyalkanoate) depolymerase [Ktedonobacterales bacterium]|jgi:poly(3-hydroxyalkanoate) depolymerase|nr:poly(3-hydroxyalkanoate) depolymerase [Ktedonobacterales bacterium]
MSSATTTQPTSAGHEQISRTISVLGQRLYVSIRRGDGTRTPLLIMNGIGANLELLQPFVDALDPAIEAIRFDVPGVGGSPTPLLPYRFPALAFLVGRMLDALGYGRVDTLGISWGGALAQQFALQYPWRCRKLVLVSTATGALMVPGNPSVLAKLATPRRYTEPGYMEAIAPEIYGGEIDPSLARDFAEQMRPGDARGYMYQMLGGAGWTSVPWLHCVRQRTLVVAGDDDRLIPVVNAKLMHRLIPHSKLYIFHGGHLGLVLQAHELGPVIGSFLASAR